MHTLEIPAKAYVPTLDWVAYRNDNFSWLYEFKYKSIRIGITRTSTKNFRHLKIVARLALISS